MAIDNYLYIHPKYILARIAKVFKSKDVQIGDVIEWCAQVETDYIKDISSMMRFENIGVQIENGIAPIPCNVHRIEDVYDEDENHLLFSNNGNYLSSIRTEHNYNLADGDYVYLNYSGIYVDNDGVPMIARGHEIACETFCKIRIFEEDMLFGKVNQNIYLAWKDEFPRQCIAARNNYRRMTRKDVEILSYPLMNMIQKIGDLPVKQKMTRNFL